MIQALSVELKRAGAKPGPFLRQMPVCGNLALRHHGRRGLALTYVSAARNAQESKYRGRC